MSGSVQNLADTMLRVLEALRVFRPSGAALADHRRAVLPLSSVVLVRAAGIEPARTFRSYGFSYHFDFRRRHIVGVCGLDYPFTLAVRR